MEIAQPRPSSRALSVLLGPPCLSHYFLKDLPQQNPCWINSSSASFPCVPGEKSPTLGLGVAQWESVCLPRVYPWLPLVCMCTVLSLTQSRDNRDKSLLVPTHGFSQHFSPLPLSPSCPTPSPPMAQVSWSAVLVQSGPFQTPPAVLAPTSATNPLLNHT